MSDGEKSKPWTGPAGVLMKFEPPGSVIAKILVNYNQTDAIYGM
jgi:hypothetical protein